MNYYEHHLGDYLRDTVHLSMVEDGAYRRLLDCYYSKEQPIPPGLKDACRLARATSKAERDAVRAVLVEFFEETSQGWRHRRCDAEIGRYKDKRQKAQRSAQARWSAEPKFEGDTSESPSSDANAMRPHAESNAHHTPDTNHQTPNIAANTLSAHIPPRVQLAALVCKALKGVGLGQVNPSDQRLAALLERGATIENFTAAAEGAKRKRNPFAYLLATVQGHLDEAEQIASGSGPPARARTLTRADQRAKTIAELTGQTSERINQGTLDASAINVDARFVA